MKRTLQYFGVVARHLDRDRQRSTVKRQQARRYGRWLKHHTCAVELPNISAFTRVGGFSHEFHDMMLRKVWD